MGYTHYFNRPAQIAPRTYAKIVADVAKILAASKTTVCRESDRVNEPAIAEGDMIVFNGKGEDGHETFFYPRVLDDEELQFCTYKGGKYFQYCKTARKDYDTVVVACLMVIAKHSGKTVTIESDGSIPEFFFGKEAGMGSASALVGEVLGNDYLNGVKFPYIRAADPIFS